MVVGVTTKVPEVKGEFLVPKGEEIRSTVLPLHNLRRWKWRMGNLHTSCISYPPPTYRKSPLTTYKLLCIYACVCVCMYVCTYMYVCIYCTCRSRNVHHYDIFCRGAGVTKLNAHENKNTYTYAPHCRIVKRQNFYLMQTFKCKLFLPRKFHYPWMYLSIYMGCRSCSVDL